MRIMNIKKMNLKQKINRDSILKRKINYKIYPLALISYIMIFFIYSISYPQVSIKKK